MLSKEELQRYSRHLILTEVGTEGQQKLKAAKVLIVGMGGLGSPIGLYLAAAGVGTLGLIDFDKVSLSNLHRQVLFTTDDIGNSKALVAEAKLKSLNPGIQTTSYNLKLTTENALELFQQYDIIADGSDNFTTRYLVNDTCVCLGKPNVYGSILRFEGQVSVYQSPFEGGQGDDRPCPCYRCLYPDPPSPGTVPSCEEAGVIGVLPGIVGSIQANEVIKLIIGKGGLLTGRLLILDALKMQFRELTFEKNPDCPTCNDLRGAERSPRRRGSNPGNQNEEAYNIRARGLVEFSKSRSGGTPLSENTAMNIEISPLELKQKLDSGERLILLDVREPYEKEIADIGGVLIPMSYLPLRMKELNKDDDIIVYCHVGGRSSYAAEFLRARGFKARNLSGGINAWSESIDPAIPIY